MTETVDGFDVVTMTFNGRTRDVLVSREAGRPVIVMHEVFGLQPAVVRFARLLISEGFKVYVPVLFGRSDPDGDPLAVAMALPCVAWEFRVLAANDPGPWADWIRECATRAFNECVSTPGPGVGVIGLCLTGNLALSAAMNPVVTAPVMSEPSLPLLKAGGLHISPAERAAIRMRVETEGLVIKGFRFSTDRLCKPARFSDLRDEFGPGFDGSTIEADKPLHAVFTKDLYDAEGVMRHDAFAELITYLRPRI